MKNTIISIVVLCTLSIGLSAQKKENKERKADKYYRVYSFEKAIRMYTHTRHLSMEGQRRLAKSYQNLNQNLQSEAAYAQLISLPAGILPEDYFNYAMVLKSEGKYEDAGKYLDKFNELNPNDLRAKDYEANKGKLDLLSKDDGRSKTEHLDFNTDAEDFGTSFYKNQIVFASTRTPVKWWGRKYRWNNKPFLDLYVSDVDGNQFKIPQKFGNGLNGNLHDGPASFNKDGTFMAYSRNDYSTARKDRVVRIQICFSSFKDGQWSKPEPFILNNKDYSVGHPCLSSDGNTMYFTSDMPGGFGGVDIYRIKKNEKGEWSKAENLGNKINTEGDELFPFYEEKTGVLFFSSNGHMGLGGLDIFISKATGTDFGPAVNAGYPINSKSDDFAIVIDGTTNKGYFSSNREGGSGDDDIYSVEILKPLNIGKELKGIAMDKNSIPVPATFISLLNEKGELLDTLTTKADGAFSFLVNPDKNFKLSGKKENYIEGDANANTFGTEFAVQADIVLLTREENITQKLVVGTDLGKLAEQKPVSGDFDKSNPRPVNEIAYFDFDKSNIRTDAGIELDKIVVIMNQYPNMIVELKAYADCRGSIEYNQILSDKRAQASAEYIKRRITNPKRIYGKGYGKTNMVSGCESALSATCTDANYQMDRRTEFTVVKKTTITNSSTTSNF